MTSEPIRCLHHFACTGGTLIAKCMAGMPNVMLLNEVDPLSRLHLMGPKQPFLPTDPIAAIRYAHRDVPEDTIVAMFCAALDALRAGADRTGLHLVLRDHTHSHFCMGPTVGDRPTFREIIARIAPVHSLVTVRHPMNSYVSLVHRKWDHFTPATLDEYAARYMAFLDAYEDVAWYRYEDFVTNPTTQARRFCDALELPFSPRFEETLPLFALSGDSGRSGETIGPRPQRGVPDDIALAMERSPTYSLLCERLGYDERVCRKDCR